MPADPVLLSLSIVLAGLVGYATSHGGVCAVRAVEELLDGRSGALFLAFLECSVWVAAITLPLAWAALPGGHFATCHPLTWQAAAGGFLFGIGAALNGGCAFSTVTQLGAGDLGRAFTLLGLGLGAVLHLAWMGQPVPPAVPEPGPLGRPEPWSLALLAATWAWAARRILRLRRRSTAPGLRAGRALATIALAGGTLYLLHGSWLYTAGLAEAASWLTQSGPAPSPLFALLFAATMAGAALAAWRRGVFRPRRPRLGPASRALLGGALMGLGAGLVPGGNDAMILHALPALLPHAALAYTALVAGVACTLPLLRAPPGFWQGCTLAQGRPSGDVL